MTTLKTGYHHGDLRMALIDAGLHLTRAGGPDALTIREATRRVGVSPNAAYRHFADRDELLAAVCTAAMRELADRMAAGVALSSPLPNGSSLRSKSRKPSRAAARSSMSPWRWERSP